MIQTSDSIFWLLFEREKKWQEVATIYAECTSTQLNTHEEVQVLDAYFNEVLVLLRVPLQAQPSQQVLFPSLNQLIENVEVSLSVILVDHAGLLQQVVDDVASHWSTLPKS